MKKLVEGIVIDKGMKKRSKCVLSVRDILICTFMLVFMPNNSWNFPYSTLHFSFLLKIHRSFALSLLLLLFTTDSIATRHISPEDLFPSGRDGNSGRYPYKACGLARFLVLDYPR